MSRTMPTDCDRCGGVVDWGDFGPDPDDNLAGTTCVCPELTGRSPLDAGRELCEALGLDPNRVQSIVIRWTASDLPRARVTLIDVDGQDVIRTIGRYRLEVEPPPDDLWDRIDPGNGAA